MPLLKSDDLCVFTLSRTHSSFPEVLKEAKSEESSAVLNRKKRKEGSHINKHQTLLPQECRACDFCPKTLNLANKHKHRYSRHFSKHHSNLEKQGESEPKLNGGGLIRKS